MKTILVVDDDLQVLNVLTEILSFLGYQVVPRLDAMSALAVVRDRTRIDLVMTDYDMPGINGLELIKMLRPYLPSAPMIMLSGNGSVEIYLKSLSLGAFEYLNKPVTIDDLSRVLRSALGRAPIPAPAPVA